MMEEYDPTIEDGSMYSSADEEPEMVEGILRTIPTVGAKNSMPQAPPPPSLAVQVAKVMALWKPLQDDSN